MATLLTNELAQPVRTDDSTCFAEFEETLNDAPGTSVAEFVRRRPTSQQSQLVGLVAIELRHRCSRGEPCEIESYLAQFPELASDDEHVLDLIYAEYCARRRVDSSVQPVEYYQRFPKHTQALGRLFAVHSLLADRLDESERRASFKWPETGDAFHEFQLLRELGRGAFGRVFLAHQSSLSNRLVVVKITPIRSIEHQTLARLKHAHIVPIHSVHRDDRTGLQAVCMPYQSAVALNDVLAAVRAEGATPLQAAPVVQAVSRLLPPGIDEVELDAAGPPFPRRADYVVACGWIAQKLASALAHAHARGILHRDLKPSNVLLTACGQPLLVDFNLAFNESDSGGDTREFFGGTLPYMPPEQIEALHPSEAGSPDHVDPRSDIFSLGVTLFEMLTGKLPFAPSDPRADRVAALREQLELRHGAIPSAREANPQVPTDLDALIKKCLAPTADHRYETATELADDLQRFLDDWPLRHIGRIPTRQRLLKFARRNRRKLGMAAAALVAAGLMGISWRVTQLERARREQLQSQNKELQGKNQELNVENDVLQEWKETANTEARRQAEGIVNKAKRDYAKNSEHLPAFVYRLGYESFSSNKFPLAIALFDHAISLGYDRPQVHFYKGSAHAVFDEDERALQSYSRAIDLNPNYLHARLNRAILFASSREEACRDDARAVEDIEQVLAVLPEDEQQRFILWDAAKVFSSVAFRNLDQPNLELAARAEQCLRSAVSLGLSPKTMQTLKAKDRFRMIDPLLEMPSVKAFLSELERAEPESGSN